MTTWAGHTILYVDDSLNDHLLFREAAVLAESKTLFVHLSTIDSARTYFEGQLPFSPRKLYPLPAAVLLDWNLPPHTGADLLTWLHAQPAFSRLPVVIYSRSDEPGLSALCYQAGATHFITKPAHLLQIIAVIHSLEELARGNPRALARLPGYQPKSLASAPRGVAFHHGPGHATLADRATQRVHVPNSEDEGAPSLRGRLHRRGWGSARATHHPFSR